MTNGFFGSAENAKVNFCYNDGKISVLNTQADELYGCGRTVISVDIDGKSGYTVDLLHEGEIRSKVRCYATDNEQVCADASFIEDCTIVSDDGTGVALSVKHTCGRVDSIIINRNFEKMVIGSSALIGLVNIMCVGTSGEKLYRKTCGNKVLCGKVISFTGHGSASASILAELSENIDAARLSGRFISIGATDNANTLYEIRCAESVSCGVCRFEVESCTVISGLVKCDSREKDDAYSVKCGAEFKIIL